MKQVPLSEASGPQMKTFAAEHLGMNFAFNHPVEDVRAKIASAWDKDYIMVDDPKADKGQAASTTATQPAAAASEAEPAKGQKKMVKIMINRTDEPGGDRAVEVGVNGKIMLIPRGEMVDIPEDYYHVLQNAEKFIYDSYEDGGMNPVPRKVMAYPVQRMG